MKSLIIQRSLKGKSAQVILPIVETMSKIFLSIASKGMLTK